MGGLLRRRRPQATSGGADLPVTAITRLFRNRPQLALLGRLLGDLDDLRVRIHGVADGSEAVSVLIALAPTPDAGLRIEGYDIEPAHVAAAQDGRYSADHFAADVDPHHHGRYLVADGDAWVLRPEWRRFLSFAEADVTTRAEPPLDPVDLVMCQNTLVGMPPDQVERALDRLVGEVASGGLLAVGGGRLDVVPRLVLDRGLAPVLDDVEAIHEAWEVQRAFHANPSPPWWALEPYDASHPDGPARYCTLFRKAGP